MDKVIETTTEFLPLLSGKREKFTIRVKYDKKADKFYALLPDHLAEQQPSIGLEKRGDGPVTEHRTSDGRTWGTTPKDLLTKIKRAAWAYEKAVTSSRKVICYKLKTVSYDEWGKHESDGGLHFEKGVGLVVHYEVGFEVKVGEGSCHIWRYDPTKTEGTICNNTSVGGDGYVVIEWTEAREAFFEDLQDKLTRMVARCREFLGEESSQNLLTLIDTGRGALLLEGPKK